MNINEIIRLIPNYDPYEGAEDYYFDEEVALAKIEFIELSCIHTKGKWAGKPLLLDVWQKAIVGNLFGWKHKKTKKRRYSETLIYVPRKNGKTLLSAALANTLFFTDDEPGAEVYTCGFEKGQASLSWSMAKQMILNQPYLRKQVKVLRAQKIIEKPDESIFMPLSHESESKHGFNTHAAVFDELHTYKNDELIDTIETSQSAREQPLNIFITTADYERVNSPCNEKHDYAHEVLKDPTYDLNFLPVIYEAPKDLDWKDPKAWEIANPGYGISVPYEYLKKKCDVAQKMSSKINSFKRLHLNLRTDQDVTWISQTDWKKCYNPDITFDDLRGQTCFGGLDLASTRDLAALVYWFPELLTCFCRFWVPKATALEKANKSKTYYMDWERQGFLNLTKGNVIDYDEIHKTILLDRDIFNITSIGIDRWNATQLTTQLTGDGVDMIPFGQGFGSMSQPTKDLEKRVLGEQLNHMNNPILAWCLGNIAIKEDPAGNQKPDKGKSAEKIDGIVSFIMALGVSILTPVKKTSIYETRGVISI